MDRILYRKILIATAALIAVQIIFWSFFSSFLPEALRLADESFQAAKDKDGSLPYMLVKLCFLVTAVVGGMIGLVGLYFFKRWALLLNTVLFFSTPLTHFFLGYNLTAWPTSAISDVLSTLFGGLMALAWFTPLRNEFTQKG